jgi:8-oxo-dGTP pyrophosphatase MutT (NUDIX family)
MSNWQRIDTKAVYQNTYITIHEDNVITPEGKPEKYAWIETPPAVFVVAIDSDSKVILVKQVRYLTGQPSWELPGGSADGQDPLDAAKEELEQEAGFHADKWVSLTGEHYVWSGVATQRNTVHIARELHKAHVPKNAGDEIILAVQPFSWSELKEMIKSGEFNDGESITALTRAGLHLGHFK